MIRTLSPLLVAILLLPGCLIGSSTDTDYSGRYISEDTIQEVQPGASKDFVLELCGEPTSRIDSGGGAELWKWEYSQETASSGSVFLLLGSSKTSKSEGAVWVKFEDERVVRAWRDALPAG
ncbi:MAG: outer membrane protein assembly factor BamE [bacterium]|nr:outer membrane protein assembly factor BamE [bacterium]